MGRVLETSCRKSLRGRREKKIQAKSAIKTAPARPATPKSIALTDTAPDLGDDVVAVLGPVVVVGDVLGEVVVVNAWGVVVAVVAVVRGVVTGEVIAVVTPVVAPPVVPVPPVVAVELRQDASPGCTVNGADWAVAPVLSFKVRPREVPAAILTVHVRDVLLVAGKVWIAGAVG
jgi:hypothetical protein